MEYYNVKPGKEYTLTATLMVTGDRTGTYQNGDTLTDTEGKVITKTITFVPENRDGSVVVPVAFSGNLIPEMKVVAFETMRNDKGLIVAVHNDLTDREQTSYVVKIGTAASVDNRHEALGSTAVRVTDSVLYSNVVPGLNYRLKGILMDRESGEPVRIGGKTVTADMLLAYYSREYDGKKIFDNLKISKKKEFCRASQQI